MAEENDFSDLLGIINLKEPIRGRYPNVTDTFTILSILWPNGKSISDAKLENLRQTKFRNFHHDLNIVRNTL